MSRKLVLSAYHVCEWEDAFYFVANEFNALYRIDKQTKKIEFVDSIPNELFWGNALVSKIVDFQDDFIFVPLNAKKIWIRNMKSGSWRNITLGDGEEIKLKFFQAVRYDSKIYLIGCQYPAIVCLNMKTNYVEYIETVMDYLEDNCCSEEKMYFRNNYVQIDSYFYMASCKTNCVLKYNMKTDRIQLIKIGNDECGYAGIAWDGEKFLLAPRHGGIVKIWHENEENKCFELLDFKVGNDDFARGIAVDKDRICLFTNRSTLYTSVYDLRKIKKKNKLYWIYDCSDRIISLTGNGNLLVYKNETEKFQTKLEIEKDRLINCFKIQYLMPDIHGNFNEKEYFDLRDYLRMVKWKDYKENYNDIKKENEMIIWRELEK